MNTINQHINDCWNKIGVWGDQIPRCERLKDLTHCHNCDIYSKAASQILNRRAEDNYLSEWKHNLNQPRNIKNLDFNSALIFRLGDEWFALASKLVKEITHCDKHHSLPHIKNNILRGLVNVHGELLLNVSLGYLFKISKSETNNPHTHERYVVIEDNNETYAFPVTEVKEIIHYKTEDIQTTPSTINKDASCFIEGIIRHKNNDVGILNSQLVFDCLLKYI
jgi:chemotaxis-related protein WspD